VGQKSALTSRVQERDVKELRRIDDPAVALGVRIRRGQPQEYLLRPFIEVAVLVVWEVDTVGRLDLAVERHGTVDKPALEGSL
jgi:hypothetical protein